jgi:hypothetical protein
LENEHPDLENVKPKDLYKHIKQNQEKDKIDKNIKIINILSE